MWSGLGELLAQSWGLRGVRIHWLNAPVNDVAEVSSGSVQYALKIYHRLRTPERVQWECDLLLRLGERDAPVARPVPGRDGYVQTFMIDGVPRAAVLFQWAPGAKPIPSRQTYELLGEAAARIHRAADDVAPTPDREDYDVATLVEDQLARMGPPLEQVGVASVVRALADRLSRRLAQSQLDRGVCHMDLTLDNLHVSDGGVPTVFDFDSAGRCWRAVEPWGVLRFSRDYFRSWLTGYRRIRPFAAADEQAVSVFGVLGDLRVTAWKLGAADSSRGKPLLRPNDLPAVVEQWLRWEASEIDGR